LAWHWLARAFPALDGEPLLDIGASYVVAWAAGVVVFFAPGGIGVRELAFLSLSPGSARASLAWLAVFARVWHLLADLLAWGLGAVALRLRSRRAAG
jgi:uncharacterized membrane protein YbhN (UPF0104 family)